MRLMRLAVGGALAQREAQRMVAEKIAASAEAQAAAITKMLMGGGTAAATKSGFCCLSAKGAGKPTPPYTTLISFVPGRPASDCARRCRALGTKQKKGSEHDVPRTLCARSRACGVCQGPQGQVARRASNLARPSTSLRPMPGHSSCGLRIILWSG